MHDKFIIAVQILNESSIKWQQRKVKQSTDFLNMSWLLLVNCGSVYYWSSFILLEFKISNLKRRMDENTRLAALMCSFSMEIVNIQSDAVGWYVRTAE